MNRTTKRAGVRIPVALLLAACVFAAPWTAAQERRNWFDDPFFQLSAGVPDCPVPLGPLLTQDEHRREAHYRAERGTSCWLAGKCRHSNAYFYDRELAGPVRSALAAVPGIDRTSIWVTIQRRWVFLEGCVDAWERIQQLERAAAQVPEVEAVVPALGMRGDAALSAARCTAAIGRVAFSHEGRAR